MASSGKGRPKYTWLLQQLSELIEQNAYQADSCLPSEREICDRYEVSRITVRRALAEMEKAGSIYRIQGKGAFVRKEKFAAKLPSLTSLTEDMQELNISCQSRILTMDLIPASAKVSHKLQLEDGSQVLMLKRLRVVGGTPLAIETCYLPPAVASVVKCHMADDVSLYRIFREHCGVSPVRAQQSLEIGLLESWEQHLLGEDTPSYAMFTTRVAFDEDQKPLEYVEGKYRGDLYTYHVTMTAENSHGWSQS